MPAFSFSFAFFFCFIFNVFSLKAGLINYADDVSPIIQKNCVSCHSPGRSAPFELLTYEDVASHAKMIAYVVDKKLMPPWPADPTYRHFASEKILRKGEIDTILQWTSSGMERGDSMRTASGYLSENSIAQKPDLVLRMKHPLFIKGDNKDRFYVMKFPIELKTDTFIRSIEFNPGNPKIVHHMNAHLLRYDKVKKKDLYAGEYLLSHEESTDIKQIHKKMGLLNDDGSYPTLAPSVCNYLPGMNPVSYPEGIGGYKLNRKSALYLNDLHYGPTAVDEYDSSSFSIFFGPRPIRPLAELILGTLGRSPIVPEFIIPADSVKKFRTELKIQTDISILSINPHMHLLGKIFLAYAVSPAGDTIPLIRIPEWNFRWQYVYSFPKILKIPAGSRIIAEGTFDNTVNNPENPFHPPQKMTGRNGSMKTTEEMFQLIISFLPYHPGDESISLGP